MAYRNIIGRWRRLAICAVKIIRCFNEEVNKEAVGVIYEGRLVVYPTDTVYGLGFLE